MATFTIQSMIESAFKTRRSFWKWGNRVSQIDFMLWCRRQVIAIQSYLKLLICLCIREKYNFLILVVLAAVMNRVLEISWHKDGGCGVAFHDLFTVSTNTSRGYRPYRYVDAGNTSIEAFRYRNMTACRIDLSQHGGFMSLFLYDMNLFLELDAKCPILHIYRANCWFGKEVLDLENLLQNTTFNQSIASAAVRASEMLKRVRLLKKTYPAPFRDILNKFYPPKPELVARAAEIQATLFHGKPYLAIHSRAFYENGTTVEMLCRCAKQLLDNGNVSKVLFVTEAKRLVDIATSIIAEGLVTVNKSYVQNQFLDSYDIRDSSEEMQQAVVEWLLVGDADLCMSSTVSRSTFSQTSIIRGTCKYIPFDKKAWILHSYYNCADLTNNPAVHFHLPMYVQEGIAKEILADGEDFFYRSLQNRSHFLSLGFYNLPLTLSQRYLWWGNITWQNVLASFECIHENSVDFIERYYFY